MSEGNGKRPYYERVMHRCATCKRWWSVGPAEAKRCPCGGELEPVDMTAHIQQLPAAEPEKK